MMLLLAQVSEYNDLLEKNIWCACSTNSRAIETECMPSDDSLKNNNMNEDEKKTNREDVKKLLEAVKEEGWTKP